MHAVPSQDLLNEICELMGWDFSALTTRQWTSLRTAYGAALKRVWEAAWWPELMQTPRLPLRDVWVDPAPMGTIYQAGSEVYFARSRGYYLALVDTNVVPAARDVVTEEWGASDGYWFQMADEYESTDWSPATTSIPLGVYLYEGRYWVMRGALAVTTAPDEDAVNWIELPVIDPLLNRAGVNRAPLGRIRAITVEDPAKTVDPTPIDFIQGPDGWRVPDWDATVYPVLYVEHRQMTPAINGDSYDATATYTQDVIAGAVPTTTGTGVSTTWQRKYSGLVTGNGTNTITVTHNLGTSAVVWSLREAAVGDSLPQSFAILGCAVTSDDAVEFTFGGTPTAADYYMVTIIG